MQLVTALLLLAAVAFAADPDAPRQGSKNLDKTVDCSGVVAFSATGGRIGGKDGRNQILTFENNLKDRSVGFSRQSGIFTVHCPGLYQFSFTGTCDECRFSLRKRPSGSTTSWNTVVTTGKTGGSHLVLLDMELGEQMSLFLDNGVLSSPTSHSFSGLRVAKK